MANFSKYFHQAIAGKTCADFAHPDLTCGEVQKKIFPILLSGSCKYFLPIILIPAFAKYDKWSWDFWKKYLKVSSMTVIGGGLLPGLILQGSFCGLFDLIKNYYFLFIGVPILAGTLCASALIPGQIAEVMALGGCNHSIEFLFEALKGTPAYKIRDSVPNQTFLFMICSAAIVYFYKTSKRRRFWLLNVDNDGSKSEQNPGKDKSPCNHEDSCYEHIWKVFTP